MKEGISLSTFQTARWTLLLGTTLACSRTVSAGVLYQLPIAFTGFFAQIVSLSPGAKVALMVSSILFLMFAGHMYMQIRQRMLHGDVLAAKKNLIYARDIPTSEALLADYWLLSYAEETIAEEHIIQAWFSKWIRKGYISMSSGEKAAAVLHFYSPFGVGGGAEYELWQLLCDAAEQQQTMQAEAFGRWGNHNTEEVEAWLASIRAASYEDAKNRGYIGEFMGKERLSRQGISRLHQLYTLKQFMVRYLQAANLQSLSNNVLLEYAYLLNAVEGRTEDVLGAYADLHTDPSSTLDTLLLARRFCLAFASQIAAVRAADIYRLHSIDIPKDVSLFSGFAEDFAAKKEK